MNQLIIGKTEFQIPSNVNELSGRQQVWLAGLTSNASPFWILFSLIMHPVNGRKRIYLTISFLWNLIIIPFLDKITLEKFTWTVRMPLSDDVDDAISFLTEWIGADDRPLVNPPFQRLWLYFVSPGLGLQQLSFGQFIQAEQTFHAYINSDKKDPALLAQLAAALYVPVWSGWMPGIRHLSMKEKIRMRRAKSFQRYLSMNELKAILHYYSGSRRAVVMLNLEVFGSPQKPTPGDQKKMPAFNLRKLKLEHADWFNQISENPRNNAATHNLPVWEVLSSMCSKIRESKRLEAELKKNNP